MPADAVRNSSSSTNPPRWSGARRPTVKDAAYNGHITAEEQAEFQATQRQRGIQSSPEGQALIEGFLHAPREHPILFRDRLVRAILDERKTQTRRISKVRAYQDESKYGHMCPYGNVGDRLWVREAWAPKVSISTGEQIGYEYRADTDGQQKGWKPSIHMPRVACRLFLEITDVRLQRLQDITEADAIAEGLTRHESGLGWAGYRKDGGPACFEHPRMAFASLWDSINGDRGAWATNPWVWAVTFKRVPS